MKKVVIHANGGKQIGMGHIMRTSVLGKKLREHVEVIYTCQKGQAEGISYLQKEGFPVEIYEAAYVMSTIGKINPALVITDSYAIDETYFKEIKACAKKTMFFDDLNQFPFYDTDIILNQNIGAEKIKYNARENCKLLLGAHYVLLRDEFKSNRGNLASNCTILVTTGGSNPNQITQKILNIVKETNYHYEVVVGQAFSKEDQSEIHNLASRNMKVHITPKMADVMNGCRMAISACGSTVYELSALGIPTIGIITADNQLLAAQEMEQAGIMINTGSANQRTKQKLLDAIELLMLNRPFFDEMSEKQKSTVHLHGDLEVVKEIMELL